MALPAGALASDVAKADRYSKDVAVEVANSHSFAVAPVADGAGPSPLPVLLGAALLTAVAGVGGALLGRRWTQRDQLPVTSGGRPPVILAGAEPVARPEPVASPELRRLRRSAQQKTMLARSVAELLPSMPEALVWQAEKALAEAGVRAIVPDGEPFDAAVHYAVGTEPVPRGGRENTIARTVRPGYADDENILVYPKVVVYADDVAGRPR